MVGSVFASGPPDEGEVVRGSLVPHAEMARSIIASVATSPQRAGKEIAWSQLLRLMNRIRLNHIARIRPCATMKTMMNLDALVQSADRQRGTLGRAAAGTKDGPSVEFSIGFGPEVGKEMMAAAALALGPQCRQVDRADHDLLARAGIGLREDSAVEVDDHAAAGPRERRIIPGSSRLDWPRRQTRSSRRPARG